MKRKIKIILFFFILIINLIYNNNLYGKDKFIVSTKREAEFLFNKALLCIKNKDWEQALKYFYKLIKNYPNELIKVQKNLYWNVNLLILYHLNYFPSKYKEYFSIYYLNLFSPNELKNILPFIITKKGSNIILKNISLILYKENYEKTLNYLFYYLNYPTYINQSYKLGVFAQLGLTYYGLGYKESLKFLLNDYRAEFYLNIGGDNIPIKEYLAKLLLKIDKRKEFLDINKDYFIYGYNKRRDFNVSNDISKNFNILELKKTDDFKIKLPEREKEGYFFYNREKNIPQEIVHIYPLIINNTIYINNGKEIFAYDVFLSKEKWRYKGLVKEKLKSSPNLQVINKLSYYKGYIYANIEGKTPTQKKERWRFFQIRKILPERRLVKLNAETGEFIWKVQNSKSNEESFENKVSFMSPPLMWDNILYVGGTELRGLYNCYIIAIDPKTGKILWKTYIGSSQQELNMFGRPIREAVGSSITAGNGQIYYLTNLGACCSIDPLTHNINWIYIYDRIPLPSNSPSLFVTYLRPLGWFNNPVILYGKYILIAPLDSNYLYCLNSVTGKKIWRYPRSTHRFLLGVSDNKVIIGGDKLQILDIFTGRLLKTFFLGYKNNITGTGFISNNNLFFPTKNYLYKINLKNYSIKKRRWFTFKGIGHLITSRDFFITVSNNHLNIYYNISFLEKKYKKLIKENNFPINYLKLADLYLSIGKRKGNLSLLLKAKKIYEKILNKHNVSQLYKIEIKKRFYSLYTFLGELYEKNNDIEKSIKYYKKALLFSNLSKEEIKIYLKLLKYYNFNNNLQRIENIAKKIIKNYGNIEYYFEDLNKKIQLKEYVYKLLAKIYEKNNQIKLAVDTYQRLLLSFYNKEDVYRLVKQRIGNLINIYGRKIYKKYDEEVKKILKEAYNDSIKLLEILNKYPNTVYYYQIIKRVVYLLIKEKEYKKVIKILENSINEYKYTPQQKVNLFYFLIICYEKKKLYSSAKSIILSLSNNFPQDILIYTLDNKKIKLKDFIKERLNKEEYREVHITPIPTYNLWSPNTIVKLNLRGSFKAYLVPIFNSSIENNKVFINKGAILYCYDAKNIKILWKIWIGVLYGIWIVDNKFLIGWGYNKIYKIKIKNGEIIWTYKVENIIKSLKVYKNSVVYISYLSYLKKNGKLVCLDYNTKSVKWYYNIKGYLENIEVKKGKVIIWSYLQLFIYDINTGILLKEMIDKNRFKTKKYLKVGINNNYICICNTKRIECFTLDNLEKKWEYLIKNTTYSKIVIKLNEIICLLKTEDKIEAIELEKGDKIWNLSLEDKIIYKIYVKNNKVYIYYGVRFINKVENYILCLNLFTGEKIWRSKHFSKNSTIIPIFTQKYLIIIENKYYRGYNSNIIVLNKFNGKTIREYNLNKGIRDYYEANGILKGGNLWVVKGKNVWIFK